MRYALLVLAVLGGLYSLHRLALWAERRGWIYYRNKRGNSGAIGNAFLEVQAMIEPSKRHVLEERLKDESESPEPGDPPEPGKNSDAP
jgi:hypothetical protein